MPVPTPSPVGLGPGAFNTPPALTCDSHRGLWELPSPKGNPTQGRLGPVLTPSHPQQPQTLEVFAALPQELPLPNPLLCPT